MTAFYLGFHGASDPGPDKARKLGRRVRKHVAEVVPVGHMLFRIQQPTEAMRVFGLWYCPTTGTPGELAPSPPMMVDAIAPTSGRTLMKYHLIFND